MAAPTVIKVWVSITEKDQLTYPISLKDLLSVYYLVKDRTAADV
jgi:hypothetical protein